MMVIWHLLMKISNIYESGYLPILPMPKFYNLSSYSLLSFLDVLSRDFLCLRLTLLGTWTVKETMTVLRDISDLGQDPCVSVRNGATTPQAGKVDVVHDLSCGESNFFVEFFHLQATCIHQLLYSSPALTLHCNFPIPSSAVQHITMPLSYTSLKGIFRRRSIPTCSFHLIAATVLSFRHSYIRRHKTQDQILQVVIINFLRSFLRLCMRQRFLFCPRSALHIMQRGLHMDSTPLGRRFSFFLVFYHHKYSPDRAYLITDSDTVKFF